MQREAISYFCVCQGHFRSTLWVSCGSISHPGMWGVVGTCTCPWDLKGPLGDTVTEMYSTTLIWVLLNILNGTFVCPG